MIATRPGRLRRALTTAATVALLTLPLAGCVQHGTDLVYQPSVGANVTGSEVEVLNAMVVSSTDGEGTFIAGLANTNDQPDALMGVTGIEESASVEVELGEPLEIAPDGFVQIAELGADEPSPLITVTGDDVRAGYYVRLRLEFEETEPVEINVPVVEEGEDTGVFSTDDPVESPSEFPETTDPPGVSIDE